MACILTNKLRWLTSLANFYVFQELLARFVFCKEAYFRFPIQFNASFSQQCPGVSSSHHHSQLLVLVNIIS